LWDYIGVVCLDSDLGLEWQDALLRDKIALSRRYSAFLSEKLRLRKLLLAPEKSSCPKLLTPDDTAGEKAERAKAAPEGR
jgi:hypothetical protein